MLVMVIEIVVTEDHCSVSGNVGGGSAGSDASDGGGGGGGGK